MLSACGGFWCRAGPEKGVEMFVVRVTSNRAHLVLMGGSVGKKGYITHAKIICAILDKKGEKAEPGHISVVLSIFLCKPWRLE
jgi:hypothetical protein